ncbi:hypothetical protein [Flaviaesturariibacter amylovorans]|uniref:DNA/RNA non-specific endonuclease n=1 Tax=Flaviaesturariibacter amylovorans TaxID=1084520 RepID=A0ABP8HTZ0_9BACT
MADIKQHFWDDMVHRWAGLYAEAFPKHGDISTQNFWGYAFVIDHVWDPPPGEDADPELPETRVLGAFGISGYPVNPKNRNIMRRYLGKSSRVYAEYGPSYDKGHFIAHATGGPIDANLFPQKREINRGWSKEGKRYREMERFVAAHPGIFVFSRPIYSDLGSCPFEVEFGYCDSKMNWRVEVFPNR